MRGEYGRVPQLVAEQAMTKLLSALADLESHGLQTRQLCGVREQLVSAIENLSRVAPRFDFDQEVRHAVQRSSVKRRQERNHYI